MTPTTFEAQTFYTKQKNGSYKQTVIEIIDYSNYWENPNRSTFEEQKFNVHGFKNEKNETKAEAVLKHCKKGSILEIGCAPGAFLKLAKEKGFDAEGIEPDLKYVNRISEYSGCKIYQGLFPNIDLKNKYDNIISMDVFEQIEDGQAFIDACKKLLKKDGKIILMMPILMNDLPFDENNCHPEHIWIYCENHLKKWLKPSIIERWYIGHEIIVI
jgi:2-polyprenyl-3-methyl-5-hydroxy-6-metoxy-1,4-benzoquinol methylase